MKYIDFKTHLNGIMSGDKNVPCDDKLKPILSQCLKQVAIKCEPLILISNNAQDDVLMMLEDRLFVRVPKIPTSNEDIMDMDEILVYAVSYLVAAKISKNQTVIKYLKEANTIINDYQWERYKDLQKGKINLHKKANENLLNIYGYKKIYKNITQTSTKTDYIWDEEFIKILDKFLLGDALFNISSSNRVNIDKFIKFSNKQIKDNKEYLVFVNFDKYLATIGV